MLDAEGLLDFAWFAANPSADLALEAERLAAGEPWFTTAIAGLQFYDYGSADDLSEDGRLRIPAEGERLSLARRPDNPHDENAVEVWWRNTVRLGHLPRDVARELAPRMDGPAPVRAYVCASGTGEAWSLHALLVGEGVRALHARHIDRVRRYRDDAARDAEHGLAWKVEAAARRPRAAARAFEARWLRAREDRLRDAVTAFTAGVAFDMEALPPVGTVVAADALARLAGCSRTTIDSMARRAGVVWTEHKRGWFTVAPKETAMTERLREELVAWLSSGRSRISADKLSHAVSRSRR